MGNVFGNFLNKEAQGLTEAINNATDVAQQENSQDADNLSTNSVENLADNRGERAVAAGQMVSEVTSQEVSTENAGRAALETSEVSSLEMSEITPQELAQATEDLKLAEERNEGDLGYEGEVSPEVERAELAHEQNLVQIEEDADSGGLDVVSGEDSDLIDKSDNLQRYDQMIAPKYVKSERAIAEGTKAAVEKVISGNDAKIADILTIYEQSANAIHGIDERAA